MPVFSSKMLIALTLLSIALGAMVAEATFLGLHTYVLTYFSHYSISSPDSPDSSGFFSYFGKLTLTALAVSDHEVALKLTFVNYRRNLHDNMKIWISQLGWLPSLPEGLKLVDGNLLWEGSAAVGRVSTVARVRAVKDGEWVVVGTVSQYAPGFSESFGSEALIISVHNGIVTDIKGPQMVIKLEGMIRNGTLGISVQATSENMTITVMNLAANQTLFFNDTMYGLRIEKRSLVGEGRRMREDWQTYMTFGKPGTSSLKPWEVKNVTISLDSFKETGYYRVVSVGWYEQNGRKVTVQADYYFMVVCEYPHCNQSR